jgi:serine/threonine protein phosphatase PrpC
MNLMRFKLESYGVSDIGLSRPNNEDVWAEVSEAQFFVLADGMGGHKAGEIAAKVAVLSLSKAIQNHMPSMETAMLTLRAAILKANADVYQMASRDENLHGMGTTLCCMQVYDQSLLYAHVGDSRIYRFRHHQLEQLTEDHSLRNELIAKGQLDVANASSFPYKNVITRAIGTTLQIEPTLTATGILPSDIYFLCSDGLTDYVSNEEIADVLKKAKSVKETSDLLVELAKSKGGNDNITIVMIKIL